MANDIKEIGEIVKKCKILLLDIEGTTTSISFVKDKLFPYAEENVKQFLDSQWDTDDVKEAVAALRKLALEDKDNSIDGVVAIPGEDASKEDQIEGLVNNVKWQMSSDRKAGALKLLQGLIWKQGYDSGDIKGHVYDDVSAALEQWRSVDGQKVYIYSSGSVQAQKLLFGQSLAGDLLRFIDGHFDTAIGAKQETASYTKIVENIGVRAEDILFLTDIPKEAEAARAAGMYVALVSREGNAPLPSEATDAFAVLHSLAQLTASNKRKTEPQEEQPAKVPKTDASDDVKTVSESVGSDAPAKSAQDKPEKMEVEEEPPVVEATTERDSNTGETASRIETIIEDITDSVEPVDVPMLDVEPVVIEEEDNKSDTDKKIEQTDKEDTVKSVTKSDEDETNLKHIETKPDVVIPALDEIVSKPNEVAASSDEVVTKVEEVLPKPENLIEPVNSSPSNETLEAKPTESNVTKTNDEEQKVAPVEEKEQLETQVVKEKAKVEEITPSAIVTEIEEITVDNLGDVAEIIEDLEPVIEEPPNEDMKDLQNVGEVLEKECDEILSKVQDVTNLDNIPIKPLLNTIAEETMETELDAENMDSNDIVDRILDSELELEMKQCNDIDLNTISEIKDESKTDAVEIKVTSDNKTDIEPNAKLSEKIEANSKGGAAENMDTESCLMDGKVDEKTESDKMESNFSLLENNDKKDSTDKVESDDKMESSDKMENSDKMEGIDKMESTVKMESNNKIESIEKMETSVKIESSNTVENSEKVGKIDKVESNVNVESKGTNSNEDKAEKKVDTDDKVTQKTDKVDTNEMEINDKLDGKNILKSQENNDNLENSKENVEIQAESMGSEIISVPKSDSENDKESQVNGKAANGDSEPINVNGDTSKDEELNARLSVENGKETVNGSNGNSVDSEKGQEDKAEVADIKVKTVATEEPRTDPIEQPAEA